MEGFPHNLFFFGIIFPHSDEVAPGNYSIIVNALYFGDACRTIVPVKNLGPLGFWSNEYSHAAAEVKIVVAEGKKGDRVRPRVRRFSQPCGVVLKKPDGFPPFANLRLHEADSVHGFLRLFLIRSRPPRELFDRRRRRPTKESATELLNERFAAAQLRDLARDILRQEREGKSIGTDSPV